MPGERKESAMSKSFSRMTNALDGSAKEYIWGCNLNKEDPEIQWEFEEEDEDSDFLQHTLFLRHAVLGKEAKEGERNILEIWTKNFAGKSIQQPFVSLTLGRQDMCILDLNFSHEVPVTFRLVEGSGPVYLSGQHIVEFPEEEVGLDTELEYTEDDAAATETEEESDKTKKGSKRKGSLLTAKKQKQRGKLDSSALSTGDDDEEDDEDEDEEGEEDEEDESMEDEEMDSEEEEEQEEEEEEVDESPEKPKKGRASKAKGKAAVKPAAKEPKKAPKKAGKKGKAK